MSKENVARQKVEFHNRFGIELVGNLFLPEGAGERSLPALAVAGPFGASKEQASGFYAEEMARRGFLALAFDPSYTGESGGYPGYNASPDINTEDFEAAVDYLSTSVLADPDRIGIIGICGWGGLALNAAALDTRIRATIVSTMYDMSRVTMKGYFDQEDSEEARHKAREAFSNARTEIYRSGDYGRVGGCPAEPLPEEAPQFQKDYREYYRERVR